MKTTIPAIRGQIGETIYYSTSFTFRQIAEMVKRVDDELHTATSLKEEIQRSLNNNYVKIKEYILTKPDHFFNSLVLAVYDGDPLWTEIEFELNDVQYPNVGILSFNGAEKIFPVDGQHRVEGIKSALEHNELLAQETIGVILIGHSTTPSGMEKSRRIFSTLNRYAKPVKLGDIIALDEDDIVAIATRIQLETNPLFLKDRVKSSNSKSIPPSDKRSFTTLITLYECHRELFKLFHYKQTGVFLGQTKLNEYLKYRPNDDVISKFNLFLTSFWQYFSDAFPEIKSYISDERINAAEQLRSEDSGGNILFRPVALAPLVSAIASIAFQANNVEICNVINKFGSIERRVSADPWTLVIWNPRNHRMTVKNRTLIRLLMIRFYGKAYLSEKELNDMYLRFSTVHNITVKEAEIRIEQLFNQTRDAKECLSF